MQDFPHHYSAHVETTSDGDTVTVRSPGLPALDTAPPSEFGGPGDRWSPETLLMAAVTDCFVLGFKAIASASKLEWRSLDVKVTGKLDRVDRKMLFTQLDIVSSVTVPAAGESRAGRILEKAEESCLVTNSLSAEVRFTGNVETI